MPEFQFQEMFPQRRGHDALPQADRRLRRHDQVRRPRRADGRARGADPARRPGLPRHLASAAPGPSRRSCARSSTIREASANDRFVALELLKNANIAAGGVLPMCQDTGTAIVMGKKGQRVWTGGDDEAALARGVHKTYTETNLRYQPGRAALDVQGGQHRHQPAGADRHLCDRRRRLQVPVRRQGRRLGQQELSSTSRRRRC